MLHPTVIAPVATPEQEAIREAATQGGNLMIIADAGTGKTTTLQHFVAPHLGRTPVLALAFNVKNKKDLESRFPPNFTVKSLNGLGHSAWQSAIGRRVEVDDKKLGKLVTQVGQSMGYVLSPDQWALVRRLVTSAMNNGLIPSDFPHKPLLADNWSNWVDLAEDLDAPAEEWLLKISRGVLTQSIKMSFQGIISYDDQIYCSAMLGGNFPRFGTVVVDEAQDLNPLNHIQLQRCSSGRLIVVGDPKQAVYAFRGASTNSMEQIRKLRKEWVDLRLSTTFRCPKVVVERQQHHAPGFTAAPANPDGQFQNIPLKWTWSDIPPSNGSVAVLCRNNAPLLKLAFKLILQWVPPVLLGRDIGTSLVALSKTVIRKDDTPIVECALAIHQWRDNQLAMARANGQDEKLEQINDKAESLLAVIEAAPNVTNAKGLRQALTDLFGRDAGKVTLSTIHRAKGSEWQTVVILDPWRTPSKYAKRALMAGDPLPMAQERNLEYVAETRSRHTLILANLEHFQ